MARRTSLREFQQSVAQRLRDLASRKSVASKLGFQVGSQNWLVTLTDVSEVIPVPAVMPVPRTEDWFAGVANVRGKILKSPPPVPSTSIYSMTDGVVPTMCGMYQSSASSASISSASRS